MIRVRFFVPVADYRPVVWPVPHPFWCSGSTDSGSIVVAYATDKAEVMRQWPDAEDLDVMQSGLTEYTFTDRFAKPGWFK